MTEEEKHEMRGRIAELFDTLKPEVIPDAQFQEGIKSGHPVICARYDAEHKKQFMDFWRNENLRPSLTGECSLCHSRIMFSPNVQAATFKICLQCLVEYKDLLTEQFGKEEVDDSGAE